MRRRSIIDDMADEMFGLMLTVMAIVLAMIIATLLEIIRIYTTSGRPGSPIAPQLWRALLYLLGAWAVVGMLALAEPLQGAASFLASWSTSAYAFYVIWLDRTQWAHDAQLAEEGSGLGEFLNWPAEPSPSHASPARNGHPVQASV